MRYLVSIFFFSQSMLLFSQTKNDTIFYTSEWKRTTTKSEARYYGFKDLDSTGKGLATYYRISNIIYSVTPVIDTFKLDGKCLWYNSNGTISSEGEYSFGLKNGEFRYYNFEGKMTTQKIYINDTISKRTRFNPKTSEVISSTEGYENMKDAETIFPGGSTALQKWLASNVKYPKKSIKMDQEGKVLLSFVVETSGSISNVKIINSVSKEIDKEAIRLVKKMPKWIPGLYEGEIARTRCTIPINFTLKDDGPIMKKNKRQRIFI